MGRALVLGCGVSGKAAAEILRAEGRDVTFSEGFDVVVASPGMRVVSELQLGCEELRRKGWRLMAVTGSKGKSSVVKAVADAIRLAGGHAVACGNYGTPVCEVAAADAPAKPAWAVVEVSSFMMETTSLPSDAFEAAALLNLQEDHLDRHGSADVYHMLKRRLLGMARAARDFSETCADAARAEAGALFAGSYFDNDVLAPNGLAAAWLMRAAGLDDLAVRRAFAAFEALPHRMSLVAEISGVRYVDDSKATSMAALVAGVTMAGDGVRLIAGGLLKGDDPKIACPALTKRVKKVYLIGRGAEALAKAWRDAADCEVCGTIDRAVAGAKRDAARGETVLLSPGAASFDQFHNFGERGDVFAGLVKKEGKEK